MRWYTCRIYKKIVVGIDRLGVEKTREAECGWVIVRPMPLKSEVDQIEGNPTRYVRRAFQSKCEPSKLQDITAFEVQGKHYRLDDVAVLDSGDCIITGTDYKVSFDES